MLYHSIFYFIFAAAAVSARSIDVKPQLSLVSGSDASIQAYPFMASIRLLDMHFCGGAIIGPQHILTAAHCVLPVAELWNGKQALTIVTGSDDLGRGGDVHQVVEMHYSNKYSDEKTGPGGYDIGLFKLAKPIKFNDRQKPIPLPTSGLPEGSPVRVVAWGATSYPYEDIHKQLQTLDLTVMSPDECKLYHKRNALTRKEFCTFGGKGVGTCKGDSGSPIIRNGQVVGIVSKGIPCAVGVPDIHTDVYQYLDYIKKEMK